MYDEDVGERSEVMKDLNLFDLRLRHSDMERSNGSVDITLGTT